MIYASVIGFIILFLSGCMPGKEADEASMSHNTDIDTSYVKLPVNVREVNNLIAIDSLNTPIYEIKFVEEQLFSSPDLIPFDGDEEVIVNPKGQVFIRRGVDIYVYNSDGQHISTMGGEGKGPGELLPFGDIEMSIQENQLYAFDMRQKRINIYSLDTFQPAGTINFNPIQWERTGDISDMYPGGVDMTASKFYSFQDSLLLVRFDEPAPIQSWSRENKGQYKIHKVHSHYYLMDHEGNIVSEEVLQLDFNYMVIENIAGIPPLPIHSQQLLTVSASDSIYTAYSKEFLLKVYGPDGSYKRSLYFPIEKMPVNLDNFINNYNDSQQIRNALRESELPEYWPILAGLLIDDQNRFWIPTYSKKKDALRWYLLGRKGEFFATFEWSADKYLHPIKLGIRTIRNGHLYAFVPINSDNPFEGKFVRFRIDLMPYGSINE